MPTKSLIVMVLMSLAAGCWTGRDLDVSAVDVENVVVTVRAGTTLRNAIITAAARRQWVPTEFDARTIRCTLTQRSHQVVVDVVMLDENHYSIKGVSSNISVRKLNQWVNNLQREIAKWAVMP